MQQNKFIFKEGEMIENIDQNVIRAEDEVKNAKEEIILSNEIVGDNDGMINKVFVCVIVMVCVLLLILLIMPS